MQKRVLPILFITLLLDMIGTGMVFPIIPIIFTDPTSSSFLLQGYNQSAQFFIAGLIAAIFGLMQFVASPILGEFSDVYGRKKLLLLGVGVLAASQFIFGFGITSKSLIILLVSRAIAGLAAANFSIAQASIADVTAPQDRAKNFGLIGGAFGIGFILGPLLGGWIAHLTNNAAAPFMFAGILGIINFISCLLFLPETHKNLKEERNFHFLKGIHNIQAAFADKQVRHIYLASFLYMSGFAFLISFSGIFLVSQFGLDAGSIGTYFAFVGFFIVITQLFLLRLIVKKYNEKQILRVSLLVVALAICIYPFMGNLTLVYVIVSFIAISQGLSIANMGALLSKSVSPDKQGAALGINGSLMAFSQGIIPIVAGFGAGIVGLKAPFVAGGILIALAWSVLFVKPNHSKEH
jgi:multidrug resistance protein